MGGKSSSKSSSNQDNSVHTSTTTSVKTVSTNVDENSGFLVGGEGNNIEKLDGNQGIVVTDGSNIGSVELTDYDAVEAAKQITLAALSNNQEGMVAMKEIANAVAVPVNAQNSESLMKYTTMAVLGLGAIFFFKGGKS